MTPKYPHSTQAPRELVERVDRYLAGEITAAELAELETQLARDPQAQQFFLAYTGLHAGLYWGMRGAAAPPAGSGPSAGALSAGSPAPTSSPAPSVWANRSVWGVAGLAAALAAAILLVVWIRPFDGTTRPLATVIALENAAWGAGQDWKSGDKLPAGGMDLLYGVAKIGLTNGVEMVVEGPAKLELVSTERCVLSAGYLVAQVPPQAVGFQVDTPDALLIDQGTEFGVAVTAETTTLQVFRGAVDAQAKADRAAAPQRLTTGEAVALSVENPESWQAVPFDPHRFVRHFPAAESRAKSDQGKPYNTPRHDSIDVLAAFKPPVIDGDLGEWDRSGLRVSQCDPPYDETYYLGAMMQYDRDYLYLAAEVGDPAPLRSVVSPASDSNLLWKGGCVQVRLSTDRQRLWPLQSTRLEDEVRDPSEKFVHLTLWCYQPTASPCLQIYYGMDFHGDRVNPPGWQGRFQPRPDGRGYTLEYAIPWSLLSAGDDPPRAGDQLAANWLVHWSDEGGRTWRGQLVDICIPNVSTFTFQDAASWGRAAYK